MEFFGYIEKVEFETIIKQAKEACVKDAIKKLKEFDAMNETFFRACMPENTLPVVIKKRTNKLAKMKRAKDLKRLRKLS